MSHFKNFSFPITLVLISSLKIVPFSGFLFLENCGTKLSQFFSLATSTSKEGEKAINMYGNLFWKTCNRRSIRSFVGDKEFSEKTSDFVFSVRTLIVQQLRRNDSNFDIPDIPGFLKKPLFLLTVSLISWLKLGVSGYLILEACGRKFHNFSFSQIPDCKKLGKKIEE